MNMTKCAQHSQNLPQHLTWLSLTNKKLVIVKNYVPYRPSFTTHAQTNLFVLLESNYGTTQNNKQSFCVLKEFSMRMDVFVCTDKHKVLRVHPNKPNHKNAIATNWNQRHHFILFKETNEQTCVTFATMIYWHNFSDWQQKLWLLLNCKTVSTI